MRPRSRTQLIALAAVGALIAGPLLVAAPANAALPGGHVLFVSNPVFSDTGTGQEDAQTLASIETTDAVVTVFDGGDGSAAAWTTALAGIDLLVIPEAERAPVYVPGGTSVMSDAAAAVVKSWVAAGGDVIGFAGYSHGPLVSYLTGLDYSGVWFSSSSPGGEWERQPAANATMPAAIPNVNYSGGLYQFNLWSAELSAPVTPWYLSVDGTNLGVGSFAEGAGTFLYVAYDWYPDSGDLGSGARAAWDAVLQSFFTAPTVPAADPDGPELAATGADLGALGLGSALLIVGFGALLLVRVRARTASRAESN
jgi:hypothetical protein